MTNPRHTVQSYATLERNRRTAAMLLFKWGFSTTTVAELLSMSQSKANTVIREALVISEALKEQYDTSPRPHNPQK